MTSQDSKWLSVSSVVRFSNRWLGDCTIEKHVSNTIWNEVYDIISVDTHIINIPFLADYISEINR